MTKQQNLLGLFLILQLILAIGLYWSDLQSKQSRSPRPLFNFDKQLINRITIDSAGKLADLIRKNDRWEIASLDGLPANNGKLNTLIAKLEGLEQTWPIATSLNSQQRFEVGEDQFQRRLKLFHDDKLMDELLIGTSPGFRKTHVRRSGDDAIYSVSLSHHELPAESDSWLNRSLLAVADVSSIKTSEFELKYNNDLWAFDQADGSVEVDENKVSQLVSTLTSLQVLSLEKGKLEPPSDKDAIYRLEVVGRSNWVYELFKKDNKHYIHRNDIDQYFLITKDLYDRIVSLNMSQLSGVLPENNQSNESKPGGEKS